MTGPVQKAVNSPACLIAINDGPESGQRIIHIHVHIIPRSEDDEASSIHSLNWNRPKLSKIEMKKIAEKIKILSKKPMEFKKSK